MSILNRLVLSLHLRIPTAGQMIYRAFAAAARLNPERVFTLMAAGLPPPDRAVLRGRTREILTASYREALRRGSRGSGRDLFLYCRPWDIDLETISVEVRLWHGEMDSIVPVAMGRRLAAAIPRCRAHFLPGEGHFSLPVRHLEEILAPLAAG